MVIVFISRVRLVFTRVFGTEWGVQLGDRSKCGNKYNMKLRLISKKSNCGLRIADCGLRIADCGEGEGGMRMAVVAGHVEADGRQVGAEGAGRAGFAIGCAAPPGSAAGFLLR